MTRQEPELPEQKPAVGRIVHYVSYGTPGGEYKSECRAAVVTEAPGKFAQDMAVSLCVLNPTGQFFNRGVPQGGPVGSEDDGFTNFCGGHVYDGGTWHWPERV
jgi:hypothetical protein